MSQINNPPDSKKNQSTHPSQGGQDSFVLYSYYRSSTAYRARIALHLKKIPFNQKNIHLLEGGGQQHSPEYRALNPAGEVPTLVHNNKVISQSFAIIEYLDELFPEPRLFWGSAYDRAKIRQIAEHINCGIHPIANLKVQQNLVSQWSFTETQKLEWVRHWVYLGMEALEKLVTSSEGPFAYGDRLSAADVFIIPQIFSAQRFGVAVDEFPRLRAINELCLPMEAFKKAHPHLQPDTPEEFKGKL